MDEKKTKKYEWIGDAESTVEAPPNEHSKKYYEPNRHYDVEYNPCLLYTSPSPRDRTRSRMPSSA